MKRKSLFCIICLSGLLLFSCGKPNPPLSLHPENPHYFLFRGNPMVLIGSTEHYGAVINLDFDYIIYLDELKAKGLNVTRTFTGIYFEPKEAFGIARNTMAPVSGKIICPWARSNQPGYVGGGNKFDLNKWDEVYFTRLKDFIAEAGKRDIVVELDLFSNYYDTIQWKLSPLHYSNNCNQIELIDDHKEILSLRHPEILEIQKKMVEKILTELNHFDNLYYEICNEPYFGDINALNAWEDQMTSWVAEIEKDLPVKHLISQNVGNVSKKISNPHPAVSVFNFHYAKPPITVAMNYGLNKPIGDNETGFNDIEDVHYRAEAWDFLVAGGALYNNLDYSFTTDNEDGSFVIPPGQPGGGGVALRNQLKWLKEVFNEIDFIHMKPANELIVNPPNDLTSVRVLAGEGKQYLIYFNNTQLLNYSLRYSGYITVPVSGKYRFYTLSDDGVRLSIDNNQLITNWTSHAATADSAMIELTGGIKYPFRLEYFQGAGGAALSLNWIIPGKDKEPVPVSAFSAAESSIPGLLAEKFSDIELQNKVAGMIVTTVDAIGIRQKASDSVNSSVISLMIPEGSYSGAWIDTKTGVRSGFRLNDHAGGSINLSVPEYTDDIVLLIKR